MATFIEPGMVARRVIWHEIENELEANVVQLRDEAIEIVKAAEGGIDGAVIGDVIAQVAKGTPVDRRQPDSVDAEPYQVIDARQQAGQITFSVSASVLK